MANANTNFMSVMTRPTTNSTSRTQNSLRTNSDAKNSKSSINHSSSRSRKSNFGAELDKANAQVNNSQPQDDEVQAVAENVESEAANSLPATQNHGKNNHQQDSSKQKNLSQNENPQPVAENVVAENIVTEIISPTISSQLQPSIAVDDSQNISQNVAFEIPTQDIPKVSAEILINPDNAEIISENPSPTIPANLRAEVIDVAENPLQATSADMAFYFASTSENLLAVNDTPAKADTPNLMSIMPQSNDNKAQSMLNILSGRTWQSPKLENDSAQNLNLQNLSAQTEQTANQPLMIQPQFQPRPLNIPATPLETQPTLQAQPQLEIQPSLNSGQLQNNLQQNLNPLQVQSQPQNISQQNLNPLQVQSQPQNNFQQNLSPLQVQTQPQENFQQNLNSLQVQSQPQENFQQNLNPLQVQSQPQNISQQNLNPFQVQSQPQENFQQNLNPLQVQSQPQENFQQNLNPLQVQSQPQNISQQNLNPLQVQSQPQNKFQQNLNPLQVQSQPQDNFQQNLNPLQVQSQPTLQAQPQVQQQQFGAQIQPQINSLQPQIQPQNINRQALSDMLGVNVQVEENQPQSMPIMPLQNTTQQFDLNQQFARNFQQNFTPLTAELEIETPEQTATPTENFLGNMAAVNQPQNQPTAQVQAPEVLQQAPREDFNIPGQIVEQARMIRTATNTEMVINLKPEHLGELTLRVSVSTNGAVTASFYSDNAQVRAIIENSIVQLKQELNDQGIKVDDVEVYAGLNEDSLLNGQGQQAWQQNQQRSHRGTVDLGTVEEELDALNPVTENNLSADGVDYKV